MGFSRWNNRDHPCFLCDSSHDLLHSLLGDASADSCPYVLKTNTTYDAECKACEISIVLDLAARNLIRPALFYDKRPMGPKGRSLMYAIPSLGLEENDRLEPSAQLQNVGSFDTLVLFPTTVVFWRRSREQSVKHRCPLIDSSVGIFLESTIQVDTLHTLALGVSKSFAHFAVWLCIDANIFALPARFSNAELHSMTCLRLKADLGIFYNQVKTSGDHSLSELGEFTFEMLGPRDSATTLRMKGAETEGFLRFLAEYVLPRHVGSLPNGHLVLAAAQALLGIRRAYAGDGWRLTHRAFQKLVDIFHRYSHISQTLGIPEQPKHHLWMHMTLRTLEPKTYVPICVVCVILCVSLFYE